MSRFQTQPHCAACFGAPSSKMRFNQSHELRPCSRSSTCGSQGTSEWLVFAVSRRNQENEQAKANTKRLALVQTRTLPPGLQHFCISASALAGSSKLHRPKVSTTVSNCCPPKALENCSALVFTALAMGTVRSRCLLVATAVSSIGLEASVKVKLAQSCHNKHMNATEPNEDGNNESRPGLRFKFTSAINTCFVHQVAPPCSICGSGQCPWRPRGHFL